MDRLRTLSDRMWASFGLSSNSDKSKDGESLSQVKGKHAGFGSPELADANNRDIESQAVDNRSSEDENDDALSIASEVPNQGQGNPAPQGTFIPNPCNEVVNPSLNSNGNPIVKEEARSNFLNLNRSMSGRSELNQPLNTSPNLNQSFPAGTGTEGQYRTINDAFSPASEHDTAFITDRLDHDRV